MLENVDAAVDVSSLTIGFDERYGNKCVGSCGGEPGGSSRTKQNCEDK